MNIPIKKIKSDKRKLIFIAGFGIFIIILVIGVAIHPLSTTIINSGGGEPPENGYTPILTLETPGGGWKYTGYAENEIIIAESQSEEGEEHVLMTYNIPIQVSIWDRDDDFKYYELKYAVYSESVNIIIKYPTTTTLIEQKLVYPIARDVDIEKTLKIEFESTQPSGLAEVTLEVFYYGYDQNLNYIQGSHTRTIFLKVVKPTEAGATLTLTTTQTTSGFPFIIVPIILLFGCIYQKRRL